MMFCEGIFKNDYGEVSVGESVTGEWIVELKTKGEKRRIFKVETPEKAQTLFAKIVKNLKEAGI